jgi:hypothetical protein
MLSARDIKANDCFAGGDFRPANVSKWPTAVRLSVPVWPFGQGGEGAVSRTGNLVRHWRKAGFQLGSRRPRAVGGNSELAAI